MIRLATGSDGTKYWRPIYIGFIKNNYVRRTLCALAAPFVFVMAASANLSALAIYTLKVVIVGTWRSIWQPLKSLTTYRAIWDAPRHKSSEQFNQLEYEKRQRRLKLPDQHTCVTAVVEAHRRLRELGWQDTWNAPTDGEPFQAYVSGYTEVCSCVTYEGSYPNGKFISHDDGIYGSVHQSSEIQPLLIRVKHDETRDSAAAYALHKQSKLKRMLQLGKQSD